MSMKCLGVLILSLLSVTAQAAQKLVSHNERNCPKFSKIIAQGYFNLTVLPTQSKQPEISTDSFSQSPIRVRVEDHTLYLTSSPAMFLNYQQHPRVVVRVPQVDGLAVYGPVNVSMPNVTSDHFALLADGYGTVTLKKAPHIRKITQAGNGKVTVQGIESKNLSVDDQGGGQLNLQGHADYLYARVQGGVILRARQLPADHISVQAKDNSEAYVLPQKTLRAFAEQSGEIFYYKHLTDLTRYPVESGNVLQMQW